MPGSFLSLIMLPSGNFGDAAVVADDYGTYWLYEPERFSDIVLGWLFKDSDLWRIGWVGRIGCHVSARLASASYQAAGHAVLPL